MVKCFLHLCCYCSGVLQVSPSSSFTTATLTETKSFSSHNVYPQCIAKLSSHHFLPSMPSSDQALLVTLTTCLVVLASFHLSLSHTVLSHKLYNLLHSSNKGLSSFTLSEPISCFSTQGQDLHHDILHHLPPLFHCTITFPFLPS